MKKITILFFIFISTSSISQSKSTAIISFNADMTAKFTLDKATSKVILVLTAPNANWTSLGLGTSSSTTSGDVYVYTTSVIENNNHSINVNQDWITISNTVSSGVRTFILERALTTSDLNDLQMAFDTTNAIDVVWSRSGSAIATAPSPNRGSTTAVFTTTLGVEDIALYEEAVVFPNPTSGELYITTTTKLSKVKIYNQTGALVKTISLDDHSNRNKININDLQKAIYIFELQNETDSVFKKVIVN